MGRERDREGGREWGKLRFRRAGMAEFMGTEERREDGGSGEEEGEVRALSDNDVLYEAWKAISR